MASQWLWNMSPGWDWTTFPWNPSLVCFWLWWAKVRFLGFLEGWKEDTAIYSTHTVVAHPLTRFVRIKWHLDLQILYLILHPSLAFLSSGPGICVCNLHDKGSPRPEVFIHPHGAPAHVCKVAIYPWSPLPDTPVQWTCKCNSLTKAAQPAPTHISQFPLTNLIYVKLLLVLLGRILMDTDI